MRTRNPFVPAAIVAALTIGSLAACSSGGNPNYVSSHTPASSSSSTAASGSSDEATSEKLPSDFPKDDVPLIDGTIVVARGDKDNGWSVTVQPKGKDGFAEAKSKDYFLGPTTKITAEPGTIAGRRWPASAALNSAAIK